MTTPLRLTAALVLAAIAAIALSACGSTSSSKSSNSDAAAGQALTDRAGTASAPKAASPKAPAVEQAAIISTGTVALSAPDVADARAKVQHVADTYAGQVAEEETSAAADGRPGHARLVLRIPAASFTKAMVDLEKVARVVDSATTSKDVSTQVIDVDERVKSARASLERIRTLLARAEKVGEVISIESELASREADLNSLLAQQAHMADQTALSTINVSIDRHREAAPRQKADAGFLAGLGGGWHALGAVGTVVATVAGALLPWLPVILVIGVPLWLLLRRRRLAAPGATAE